ncbi:GNAT family N-acetyltransferase [Riemerella anatipestifer]|nr:GNAT family N-acetyltransferase [Riemerella anatipestifer]
MIKKAQREDIPLIRSLAKQSWNSHYIGIISQEQIDYMLGMMYSDEELNQHFESPNYHYYLMLNDNVEVGFMGFEIGYEPQTTKLHRLYLLAEAKGKGLGKEAIDFLKNKVKSHKDKSIILNVNKKNPSFNFYKSQGFEVDKEVMLEVGEGFVMDDYIMKIAIEI